MASLNGMLSGILDISRRDSGVITPALASGNLGELVDRLARDYAPMACAEHWRHWCGNNGRSQSQFVPRQGVIGGNA
jgi:hypothetical protein